MRVLAAAVVVAVLALAVPAASASPTWLSPVTFTEDDAQLSTIAANASGDAAVVWFDGFVNGPVRAIYRPAGGPIVGPTTIGDFAQSPSGTPQEASVAVNSAGDAVAVWPRMVGRDSIIQESFRPAGGNWGSAQEITPTGEFAGSPQAVADGSGRFIAIWSVGLASSQVVVARAPASGEFGPADPVSGGDVVAQSLAVVTRAMPRSRGTSRPRSPRASPRSPLPQPTATSALNRTCRRRLPTRRAWM